ncbi:uncharacterized protein [Atheta coriaria]|uniref:uncharacterized protein n=1 Tax=Dalotia coriaria TaxID=877792 RepID=UPI0031F397EB
MQGLSVINTDTNNNTEIIKKENTSECVNEETKEKPVDDGGIVENIKECVLLDCDDKFSLSYEEYLVNIPSKTGTPIHNAHDKSLTQALSLSVGNISFELSNLSICDDLEPSKEPKSLVKRLFTPIKTKTKVEVVKTNKIPFSDEDDFTKDTTTGLDGYIDLTIDEKPDKLVDNICNNDKKRKRSTEDEITDHKDISDTKKIKNIKELNLKTEKINFKSPKSTSYRSHTSKDKIYLQPQSTVNIITPETPKEKQKVVRLTKLPNLIKNLIKNAPETHYWSSRNKAIDYNLIFKIYQGCEEYQMVMDHFTPYDNQNDYHVLNIERIENRTLMAAFILKRNELQEAKPALPVQTKLLFHATKYTSTESIMKENFDWRMCGAARGHKYGHGTCFSPHSDFATQFGQHLPNNIYYTLLCYVVLKKSQTGNSEMILPDKNFDSSMSNDGKVIVKYHDNTAYPAYRITYRKCERYHDDIHMLRNDWYYNNHRTNNYHLYNQNYSQYNWTAQKNCNFHGGDRRGGGKQRTNNKSKRYVPY